MTRRSRQGILLLRRAAFHARLQGGEEGHQVGGVGLPAAQAVAIDGAVDLGVAGGFDAVGILMEITAGLRPGQAQEIQEALRLAGTVVDERLIAQDVDAAR